MRYRERSHDQYVTRLTRAEAKSQMMLDSETAAKHNMKSKLSSPVFDTVTAAKDSMKSKLPGAHNTKHAGTSRGRLKRD